MWPFIRSQPEKDPSDDISPSLRSFFAEEDQHARLATKVGTSTAPAKAPAHVSSLANLELANFRQTTRKIAAINCAELQQTVLDCYKGWLYMTSTDCSKGLTRTSRCMELQKKALERLRYEECADRAECMLIRILVDEMFTRNFGQYGEKISEQTEKVFESDLQRTEEFLRKNGSST